MKSHLPLVVLFGEIEQHVLNRNLYFLLNIELHLLYVVIKRFEQMLHPCYFLYSMRHLHHKCNFQRLREYNQIWTLSFILTC